MLPRRREGAYDRIVNAPSSPFDAACGGDSRRCRPGGLPGAVTLTLAVVLWVGITSCQHGLVPSGPALPNFHAVAEGSVYRSAQMDETQLRAAIGEYGIRTVLNLRGTNPDKPWYQTEARVCQELGVTLVDYAMSAGSLPPVEMMADILETLRRAEHPMLIHCSGGSDRTGAISAIYRMSILGEAREHALSELDPQYFHFRWYAPCMDVLAESFDPAPDWIDRYPAMASQPCE